MESAQLLNILGNENRRKILHLLASRPCYMSEIAERLDVGAKAILGHLELLVQSGMIEANVDEQRRKYFISQTTAAGSVRIAVLLWKWLPQLSREKKNRKILPETVLRFQT